MTEHENNKGLTRDEMRRLRARADEVLSFLGYNKREVGAIVAEAAVSVADTVKKEQGSLGLMQMPD
jgi:hypothetical protein